MNTTKRNENKNDQRAVILELKRVWWALVGEISASTMPNSNNKQKVGTDELSGARRQRRGLRLEVSTGSIKFSVVMRLDRVAQGLSLSLILFLFCTCIFQAVFCSGVRSTHEPWSMSTISPRNQEP
jgi:hypothetical protein